MLFSRSVLKCPVATQPSSFRQTTCLSQLHHYHRQIVEKLPLLRSKTGSCLCSFLLVEFPKVILIQFSAVFVHLYPHLLFGSVILFFWLCLLRPQSGPRHRRAARGVVPHHSAGARPASAADREWDSLWWEAPTASGWGLETADLWEEGSLYRILWGLQLLLLYFM